MQGKTLVVYFSAEGTTAAAAKAIAAELNALFSKSNPLNRTRRRI